MLLSSLLRGSIAPAGVRLTSGSATTGDVLATGEADVSVSFATPFLNTDFRVVASVVADAAGEQLRARRVRSVSTSGCVVNVVNNGLTAASGVVQVIALGGA